ncbi:hypothetical protein FV218_08210 [Methylobacterium sp. WL69]|nr:hypothetical protein FV218_08210 [Methylobacterium sp. WL69]
MDPAVHAASEGASRSEGEGVPPDEAPSTTPPHPRLPPRRADDKVGTALSPQAGRGNCATAPPDQSGHRVRTMQCGSGSRPTTAIGTRRA